MATLKARCSELKQEFEDHVIGTYNKIPAFVDWLSEDIDIVNKAEEGGNISAMQNAAIKEDINTVLLYIEKYSEWSAVQG